MCCVVHIYLKLLINNRLIQNKIKKHSIINEPEPEPEPK